MRPHSGLSIAHVDSERGFLGGEDAFRYNDAVLRHLTIGMKKAETTPSPIMKLVEKEEARKAAAEQAPVAA